MAGTKEEYNDEPIEEYEDVTLGNALAMQLGEAPWYVSSIALHCLMFLVLLLLPAYKDQGPTKRIIITTDMVEELVLPPDDPIDPVDPVQTKVPIESKVTVDTPVVTTTEVEISDHLETEDDVEFETAKGDPDNMSDLDSDFVGTPALMGIGSTGGTGGGGPFGRGPGGRDKKVKEGGGDPETERRVEWALKWLAAHQESDGSWDCKKYGGGHHGGDDVAVTSMALLAFLGAGNSRRYGKYRRTVRAATEWLVTQQQATGRIGPHRYTGGISTMAMAEAFGMGDRTVRKEAQLAVDWACKSQNTTGGWDYAPNSGRSDTSVTGWWIMGLKSASVAGLSVPTEIKEKALDYMNNVTSDGGNASYASTGGALKKGGGSPRMTAVTLTCRQFLGTAKDDPRVVAGVNSMMKHLPNAANLDFYLTYYQALGLFQTGIRTDNWERFNEAMKTMLTTTQVMKGSVLENKGSWDYEGDKYGGSWGRVGQTALGALMLEIYYRYEEARRR